MKNLFGRIFCLALCVFALVCGAAMAEAPEFWMDSNGFIIYVSIDPETEALEIPDKVDETTVRGIAADIFAAYPNLKYIKLNAPRLKDIASGSMDLRSAENLECVFVNFGITEQILTEFHDKIKINENVTILQYIDLKPIVGKQAALENGLVVLEFNEIIPVGYPGDYRVTRTAQGSDTPEIFDSSDDYNRFSISNGTVRFLDDTAEPGQVYNYRIEAMHPFWDSFPYYDTSISIPAEEPEENPDEVLDEIPDELPLPETGDEAQLALWSVLVLISVSGLMAMRRRSA